MEENFLLVTNFFLFHLLIFIVARQSDGTVSDGKHNINNGNRRESRLSIDGGRSHADL